MDKNANMSSDFSHKIARCSSVIYGFQKSPNLTTVHPKKGEKPAPSLSQLSRSFSLSPPLSPSSSGPIPSAVAFFLQPSFLFNLTPEMSSNSSSNFGSSRSYVTCFCGEVASIRVSWTSRNPGRRFFGCRKYGNNGCNFFDWVNKEKTVEEEMKEVYDQIRHMEVEKEDWRAVAEWVKDLNNRLLKGIERERAKREKLQRKYKQCKKSLKCARIRMYLLVFLIVVLVLCNLFN